MKKPPYTVIKKFTEDDIRDLQGGIMEKELQDRDKTDSSITLSGDIGRDDTPGPYFNWTISGNDPKKMVQKNDLLFNMLKKYKKRRR